MRSHGLFSLVCLALVLPGIVRSQVPAHTQDLRKFSCNSEIKSVDVDGDGHRDCLFLERRTGKSLDEYRVWVYLSSRRVWVWLHDVSRGSETKITSIALAKYSHPGFSATPTGAGFAYRIADYERSSRLYYFDKSLERVAIFWESD